MPEEKPLRAFRISTVVEEIDRSTEDDDNPSKETLASVGETVLAPNFTEALPKFNAALNEQWSKVAEMAPIVDAPLVDPFADHKIDQQR